MKEEIKNKKYMKKLMIEIKIDKCLDEVRKTLSDGWDYLDNPTSIIEKEDLLQQLDDAEYELRNLEELLEKLSKEYENDIKELRNE